MTVLGESKFGAMFYKVEKLDVKGTRQLRSRRVAMNWSPERDSQLLHFAHLSIHNALTFLKSVHKFPADECKFLWPGDETDFLSPWRHSPGVTSMALPHTVDPSLVRDPSKAELLQMLRDALSGNV
jgi:hypothetical protein